MTRTAARVAAVALLGAATVACGADDRDAAVPTTVSSPVAEPDPRPAPTGPTHEEDPVRLEIEVEGRRLGAVLDDSPAARDLLDQLPVRVAMRDHGGVEKTGRLPGPLSTAGQPDVGDPAVGDLGYYAPGQDLVLYYGDAPAYPGIVVLGRLDDGAAETLAAMEGDVDVSVGSRA